MMEIKTKIPCNYCDWDITILPCTCFETYEEILASSRPLTVEEIKGICNICGVELFEHPDRKPCVMPEESKDGN